MIWQMARVIRQALSPPSISSGLVCGIERLPGVRVDHMSPSRDHLPLRTFSHFISKRPWSLFLVFFLTLAILAPQLPFLFGRIVAIEVFISVRAADLPPSGISQFLNRTNAQCTMKL